MNNGKDYLNRNLTHPCFNPRARLKYARIHLAIAKKCNIQCKYCNRLYDCTNECRPGVTSRLLKPQEALNLIERVKTQIPQLSVVGIAGPGDPLANPEETFRTLELVHHQYPELILCLSTNGLRLPEYINSIVSCGVKYVTITINAIHPKIGQIIYSWVLDRGRILRGTEAAERLLDQQFTGLQMLSKQNLIVKVNTVLIPGINEDDILPLARAVQPLGAEIINVMPLIPVAGSEMEKSEAPSPQQLYKLRKSCGEILPSMPHCKQCRADAIGFLGVDRSMEFIQPENPKGSIQGQQVEPTTHQYSCAYD